MLALPANTSAYIDTSSAPITTCPGSPATYPKGHPTGWEHACPVCEPVCIHCHQQYIYHYLPRHTNHRPDGPHPQDGSVHALPASTKTPTATTRYAHRLRHHRRDDMRGRHEPDDTELGGWLHASTTTPSQRRHARTNRDKTSPRRTSQHLDRHDIMDITLLSHDYPHFIGVIQHTAWPATSIVECVA